MSIIDHQYKKFINGLSKMRTPEWKIYKKLVDAGGIGQHVFMYPARGCCKTSLMLDMYAKYINVGQEVHIITSKDWRKDLRAEQNELNKDIMLDRDLYPVSTVNAKLAEEIGEYIHEQFRKHLVQKPEMVYIDSFNPYWDQEPIIKPDSYIYGWNNYKFNPLWSIHSDNFIVTTQNEESNLD